MLLAGKRALITGSSRGIGRGIALKLAEHGAEVAVHYYTNEDAANDTLARVRERGADGCVVQADVSRPEDRGHLFNEVQDAFGALDILVSNARPDIPTFYRPWTSPWTSGPPHGRRGEDHRRHLLARRAHREPAAVGRHGGRQGGVGCPHALLRGGRPGPRGASPP